MKKVASMLWFGFSERQLINLTFSGAMKIAELAGVDFVNGSVASFLVLLQSVGTAGQKPTLFTHVLRL